MSDRLVVMNDGHIEQTGAPREVYEHPKTRFVAGFIGTSNLMTRRVAAIDAGRAVLECGADEVLVAPDAAAVGAQVGADLELTVRPEKIRAQREHPDPGRCALRATVAEIIYLGTSTQYSMRLPDGTNLIVAIQNSADSGDIAARGEELWLGWNPHHTLALATASPSTNPGDPDER